MRTSAAASGSAGASAARPRRVWPAFRAPAARPARTGVALLGAALFAGAGCAPEGDDTGPVALPPEDTSAWREDTGTFPFDTADTGDFDQAPEHVLTVRHAATWTFGGERGDPSSVTGALTITELLDGDEEAPACVAVFALVGERAAEDCPGCTATFRVLHTADGAEGGCRSPERPEDGEERTLGYAEAEAVVYWDWYDTGVWVPLWDVVPGELPGELVLTWETTLGVTVEDDD